MPDLWSEQEAAEFVARFGDAGEAVALRVYSSRLLGRDPSLVLHGGGNTSVKTTCRDLLGREVEVLCVKGSGWDLVDIEPPGLPAVRLTALRELRALRQTRFGDYSNMDLAAAIQTLLERSVIRLIEENLAACGATDLATVRQGDCLSPPPAPHPCDLVFLDPPYGEGLAGPALAALAAAGWIGAGALCVVELRKTDAFDAPDGFTVTDDRRYGGTRVVLLTRQA